jgi:glycosyltransferase involved in cell wall biosynthesis
MAHSAEMGRQFSLAFDEQQSPADFFIFPCCDAVQVQALALNFRRGLPLSAPHLVMWFLFPELLEEYRAAFAALKEAVRDEQKIAVYCETPSMAATFRDLIGLEVEVAPGANLAGINEKVRTRRENIAPSVASVGVGNLAKGYHLLPGAIERVLHLNDEVTFWVHGVLANMDRPHNLAVFESLSNMGHRVRTSNAILTSEEYLSHLLQADLLLLPYDEKIYRMRGSGVFNEAREIGIPIVATRGCGFARPAFDEGWGVEIVERTESGVADAVLTAISHLPELATRAAVAAKSGSDDVATVLRKVVEVVKRNEKSSGTSASKRVGRMLPMAQPLSRPLFSKIALSNGAALRGRPPIAAGKLLSRLPAWNQLSKLSKSFIDTSTVPYHYSLLLHVDRTITRRLERGSLLMVEVSIHVLAGAIGIVWVDDCGQPLQDSERYAVEMPGIQHVVVSIPAEHAHCLVFRNVATYAMGASFRICCLRASSIVEPDPWHAQAVAASEHGSDRYDEGRI